MNIKLLAFDLDGTTLSDSEHISEKNREALIRAYQKGVLLVPASGRLFTFLPKEVLALPGLKWVITSNGAAVYTLPDGKPLKKSLIPNETAKKIYRVIKEYDIYREFYHEGRAMVERRAFERSRTELGIPESKWKFLHKDYIFVEDMEKTLEETGICPEKVNLLYLPTAELRAQLWEKLKKIEGLGLSSSFSDNIEVNAADANKGAGLKALCDILKIPPEEVMAIGDNGNDLSMLKFAGCSVAMGDGSQEALQAAKFKTGPHDRDGLAQAIDRFILGC